MSDSDLQNKILWDFKPDDTYITISRLGSGSYGEVFKAVRKGDREAYVRGENVQVFAMKRFNNVPLDDMNREVRMLMTSKTDGACNKNVICYAEHYRGRPSNDYILLTRFVDGVLLEKIPEVPSNDKFRMILQSLLEGLRYLHSKNIVHRDIKGDNIMVLNYKTLNPTAVYLDLGLACENETDYIAQDRAVGQYKSPEQLEERTLSLPEFKASDVWFLAQAVYFLAEKTTLVQSPMLYSLYSSLQLLKQRRQLFTQREERYALELQIQSVAVRVTKELRSIHEKLVTYDANGQPTSQLLSKLKDNVVSTIVMEMLRLKWRQRLLPQTGIMLLEKEDFKLKKLTNV